MTNTGNNRFPATCFRCGCVVHTDTASFDMPTWGMKKAWGDKYNRHRDKWLIQHPECREKFFGTTVHYLYQPEGSST